MPQPLAIPDHELLGVIGRGSYGEVWLARSVLGTLRAVKVVRRGEFRSPKPYEREFAGIQRFEPVSRSHDGLVDILQVGRNDAEGYFYYVMELADPAEGDDDAGPAPEDGRRGYRPRTLGSDLARLGRLPPAEAVRVFLGLAHALAHLHGAGLVHRDIKPTNIIFVGGRPKFADIGLVCGADDTGSWVGTEGYIPPEGSGTPAADVYSLGKVLYEAALGKDRREFPALPDDPDLAENAELLELNAVIVRACAPSVEQRFPDATAFARDLGLLQAGRSVKAARRTEHRRKVAVRAGLPAAVAALVLAGVVGGIWWARRAAHAEPAPRNTPAPAPADLLAEARRLRDEAAPGWRAAALALLARAAVATNAPDLRQEAVLALASGDLRPVAWTPPDAGAPVLPDLDRERYVAAGRDGTLVFRSLRDHAELWRNDQTIAPVSRLLGFSGDGHWLVLVDGTDTLRFRRCDPGTGAWYWKSRPHGAAFGAFDHDGGRVVFNVGDGRIVLAGTADMGRQTHVPVPGTAVAAAWAPDNARIAVACDAPPVVAWALPDGTVSGAAPLPSAATALAWRPDASGIFVATRAGILDVRPSARAAPWIPAVHDARSLAVGGDGRLLAVGTGGRVEIWDIPGRRLLAAAAAPNDAVTISSTGRQLAVIGPGGTSLALLEFGFGLDLVRWDAAPLAAGAAVLAVAPTGVPLELGGGQPALRLPCGTDAGAAVRNADGSVVQVRHRDGALQHWDVARLRERLASLGLGW